MTSTDGPAPSTPEVARGQADATEQAEAASTADERELLPRSAEAGPEPGDAWRSLLAEAASKSDFLWIRRQGEQRSWPAWHVWHDDAVHVVSGGGEQTLPELDGPVDLVVRSKDTWERLLTVPAKATRLPTDDPRWADAAVALAAVRLNASVPPAQLPDVWRESATLTRIEATAAPLEEPGRYEDVSHAAPPAPTPATTASWRPWHVGGRRRRRR